ncbi:MAG TPA: MATE family efflux transporter [Clostridiales bacterium]|nr:MATE family efflux transporter [Clostridiales bacterium]
MSTNKLGTEKISKLLWQFSLPATVGMLVNAIYNVVDRLFVGNAKDIGDVGLAAITVCFPIMMIFHAFSIMMGIGGATRFSINMGRKDQETAERFLGKTFVLMIVVSLILSALGYIFMVPILKLSGASDVILPYAKEYLEIILLGNVFQTISMGLNNFIRANGSPKTAMFSMFIGAGFNIVFDAILIQGFNMGLTGAAVATIGGQALSAIWCICYFLRNKNVRFRKKHIRFSINSSLIVFSTGTPAFIMNSIGSVLNIILNQLLFAYGGDNAISAMGIVNSIQTFLIMPIIGINQGVQPIVSYNYGAQRLDRSHKALKLGIFSATVIAVAGWAVTRLFARQLVMIFTPFSEIHEIGEKFIINWFGAIFVVGFQIIASNYFQAIGKPAISTVLTLLRQVLLLIPLVIILAKVIGLYGIVLSAPIADFVSFLVTLIVLIIYLRKSKTRSFNEI